MNPDQNSHILSNSIEVKRVNSIDIVRGMVIMLMALDHVRDFWGATEFQPEDPGSSSLGWFFTRWITHFCAPVFIFLSGTSAFLYGHKVGRKKLSLFLLSRGIWLIAAEFLLVNPGWTFKFPWQSGIVMLQVIWVIGWSMVVLSALIFLDWRILLGFSALVILLHNLFDVSYLDMELMPDWQQFLHAQFTDVTLWKSPYIRGIFVYPLVPWFAVMALGYVFGKLYLLAGDRRRQIILVSGVAMLTLFILLRSLNAYGDSNNWEQHQSASASIMDYLDVSKYPPSLHYVLFFIGVSMFFLAWSESWKNRAARVIMVFGQVPFFFYLIHTPIINLGSRIYHYLRYGKAVSFVGTGDAWPAAYKPNLWLVYFVWTILLILLYFICRWYGRIKKEKGYWWMKYV